MQIRDLGLSIVRRFPKLEMLARQTYALLPSTLHDHPAYRAMRYFGDETFITFVYIGAYDGIAGDQIRPLLGMHPTWSGVMLEPQPDAFARLKSNYASDTSRLTFVNAAISDKPGKTSLYHVPREEIERLELPDWSRELASFEREHLLRFFPEARLAEQSVDVITFADAAARMPEGRTDLVVMDVEGHESSIIPSIDFDRHRVRYMIYEHSHLSKSDRQTITGLLRSHGFKLKSYGRDTVAWRRLA